MGTDVGAQKTGELLNMCYTLARPLSIQGVWELLLYHSFKARRRGTNLAGMHFSRFQNEIIYWYIVFYVKFLAELEALVI